MDRRFERRGLAMTLGPGAHIGNYEIVAPLGAGGMGEVYRARDTKLHREVALKVLPEHLARREVDRERFTREARAVAALNHPNIVTLYSVEEAKEVHFLTMELVDGEALSTRIPRRGLPVDEFLKVAIPLADAIHAAHAKGVVHRDLKPTNIMLTSEDRVKVLDFGLAKLRAALEGDSEATTRELTGEGRIVGTVAYMSPEQAEGKPLDHRTDIFSLGVVLYELATGQRPFTGETPASVMSAVIKDEPSSARHLNPALPAPLAHVIKMCLRKDPDRRYQSAKDVRNELQELQQEWASGELEASAEVVVPRGRRWVLPAVGAAAVVVIAGASYFALSSQAPPSLSFSQLTTAAGREYDASISPNGEWVVFVAETSGNADIYLQGVGNRNLINLTEDSPARDSQPAFSPDGALIAFQSTRDGGGVFVMGRTGEVPRPVADFGFNPDWSPDGSSLVVSGRSNNRLPTNSPGNNSLWTVDVETGARQQLLDQGEGGNHPAWSHDGRWIAYMHEQDIWVVPLDGGAAVQVTDLDPSDDPGVDWRPAWSPDDQYLYFASDRGGSMNLWRVPMNLRTGKPAGEPQDLLTHAPYLRRISISEDGTRMALGFWTQQSNLFRVRYDPQASSVVGSPQPVTPGSLFYDYGEASPDGQRLVFTTAFVGQSDLYISRSDGSGIRPLTADSFQDRNPRWSPDGSEVAFYSDRSGNWEIWAIDPDSGRLRQLTDTSRSQSQALYPVWSPDGTRIAYTDWSSGTWVFDPNRPWADQTPEPLPAARFRPDSFFRLTSWAADGLLGGVIPAKGCEPPPGCRGIYAYDFKSKEYVLMSEPALGFGSAFWLDDGKILYTGGGVFQLDPATRLTEPLLFAGPNEVIGRARPSEDNDFIYYRRRSREIDIWIAELDGGG